MKTRIWIVLALVAGLVMSDAFVSTAQADIAQHEWQLSGKGSSGTPSGDDGDAGPTDVEGDPENWLGGQNRPVDQDQNDGGFDLFDWFEGFLQLLTFGLFR